MHGAPAYAATSRARGKRVAILQSNYVPWRGYFDLVASVDEFIFYDDVQYTKGDWRNRNRIKTAQGVKWLTVPVGADQNRLICDVAIPDPETGRAHWSTLERAYSCAPHFHRVAEWLEPYYKTPWYSLSVVNRDIAAAICGYLGVETKLSSSTDFGVAGDRSGRLLELCRAAGAEVYVSGPAARAYLDTALFETAGLEVCWFDYSGYPEYTQQWGGPFAPNVSMLDLLFNEGEAAPRFMKYVT